VKCIIWTLQVCIDTVGDLGKYEVKLSDQCIFNVLSSILCYGNSMISPFNFSVFNVFSKFSLILHLFYLRYLFSE